MAARDAKERIVRALVGLMRKKPVQDITVKELVSAAGINRSTFYYHFYRIDDVIEHMMETLLEKARQSATYERGYSFGVGDEESDERITSASDAFFELIYRNRDVFCAIVTSPFRQRFYDQLVEIFVAQYRGYPHYWRPSGELVRMRMREREYWDRLFSYIAIGVAEQWRLRDFEETPRELTELLYGLLSNTQGFELRVE